MTGAFKDGRTAGSGPTRRAVVAGLAAAPLVAASFPGRAFAAVSGKLTITVLDFLEAPLKPVFAAYKAARPGVEIDYQVAPSHDVERHRSGGRLTARPRRCR